MKILNKIFGKSAWAGENQEVLKGEPLENGNFCTKKFAQISKILETSVNILTKSAKYSFRKFFAFNHWYQSKNISSYYRKMIKINGKYVPVLVFNLSSRFTGEKGRLGDLVK